MENQIAPTPVVITPTELLAHWQGHRSLTRRSIEVFPDEQFFTFSIGGMRTYNALIGELMAISGPGTREIVTGKTEALKEHFEHGNDKAKVLEHWDKMTEMINTYFTQITEERFHEKVMTFGQYESTVWSSLFYFIDNEIHHRAQGYVYLRSLGVEPPPFWDRFMA